MAEFSEFSRFLPLLAVGLDLLIGDPRWLPHPVRLIGNVAVGFEELARSAVDVIPEKLAGTIAALFLVLIVATVVFSLTHLEAVSFFITLYLSFSGLALRCLLSEASRVHGLLENGSLSEARIALSMLVSRGTSTMNADEIRRALAETVSENLNDGFTAPLFWLCVAGPVGMWAYKTISTLDSMWGYKTEKYRNFGWFAARVDDVLAYLPARITVLAMLVAGGCMRMPVRKTLKCFMKDARQMASPNAGWPMAAAAWLLEAQMGGPAIYHGEMIMKPVLGPSGKLWTSHHFSRLKMLIFLSGGILALAGQAFVLFLMK